jgi:hypothetical protein
MSIKEHIEDIDFRNHAERQKSWRNDFIKWHREIRKALREDPFNDRLAGQLTMLSSVLWYLLSPKEYKAVIAGKIFVDQDKLTRTQKKLFVSMNAFNGSSHCDKRDGIKVYESYMKRAKPAYQKIAYDNPKLAHAIAYNIAVAAETYQQIPVEETA